MAFISLASAAQSGGLASIINDPDVTRAGVGLVSHVYPVYRTFKALETDDPEDDKQWLTYWAIAGLATVADDLFGPALEKIPLYPYAKMSLFVWLQTGGAKKIYSEHLRPFLAKHQDRIDAVLAQSGLEPGE